MVFGQLTTAAPQPLDTVNQFPDKTSITVREGLETLVTRRRFIDHQGRKEIRRIPDGDEGRSELERCAHIERVELAAGEVEIDVFPKRHFSRSHFTIVIENLASRENSVRLFHKSGFTVIRDERCKVKIGDSITAVLGKRADQSKSDALRGLFAEFSQGCEARQM